MITVTTTPDQARDVNDTPATEPDVVQRWIAIAMRPRQCLKGQKLHWQPISGAPVSVQEARSLADAGTLLVANRYQPDLVELVVRPSAATLASMTIQTAPDNHEKRLASIQGICEVTNEFTGQLETLAHVTLRDIEAILNVRLPELRRGAMLDLLGTAFLRGIAAVTPVKETAG